MHYHLVGIGGSGLSAIAQVLLERGHEVSGSDQMESLTLGSLRELGATVALGHSADHLKGAQAVLVSSAIRPENPEVQAARRAGLPVYKRSEFLGELTRGFQTIAISGTHGKTTTTGLIAFLLAEAGLDPSFIVGGTLQDFGGASGHAGRGRYFVIEADEYDRTFLGLDPEIGVVTNVEHDHPDCYPTLAEVLAAFHEFLARIPDKGWVVPCADAPAALQAAAGVSAHVRTYGMDASGADWVALHWQAQAEKGSQFLVARKDGGDRPRILGQVTTQLLGLHNVRNCLAALCVSDLCGVPFETAAAAARKFQGARRRFEVIGETGGVLVVDDYAHHPSEIRATLAAARQHYPERRIWAVWEPHTFSRTRALEEEFVRSFQDADQIVVLPVFRSREPEDAGYSSRGIASRIGERAAYAEGVESATEWIASRARSGDLVITLSAGQGNRVGTLLKDRLSSAGGSPGPVPGAPEATPHGTGEAA
ncbi:MAG: UDP-N-acetylmuramate--L-alanine ligase [Anaerolineales bacterium]|jgi:UDP-N-acetylmuramate--alanine ligase